MLRKIPKEHRSHLHGDGSLKSRIYIMFYISCVSIHKLLLLLLLLLLALFPSYDDGPQYSRGAPQHLSSEVKEYHLNFSSPLCFHKLYRDKFTFTYTVRRFGILKYGVLLPKVYNSRPK
jgi:hypothetical protein